MSWELHCPVCWRSSWDGKPSDDDGERCPVCGQLPALDESCDATSDAQSFERRSCRSNAESVSGGEPARQGHVGA